MTTTPGLLPPPQRLRWSCPPPWGSADPDWTPPPGWEPDPAWPPAPKDWQFWTCEPAPEPAAIEDLLHRLERLGPEPPLADHAVQISWVAPPGWPAPPHGWSPPENWQPDRRWPPAPAGWQFWQREPVAAEARGQARAWAYERIRILAGSRCGQLSALDDAETRLRRLNSWFVVASSPIEAQVVYGAALPPDDPTRSALHRSYTRLCSLGDQLIAAWSSLLLQHGPATDAQQQSIWSLEDQFAAWSLTWCHHLRNVVTASTDHLAARIVEHLRKGSHVRGPDEANAVINRSFAELESRLDPASFDIAPGVPGRRR